MKDEVARMPKHGIQHGIHFFLIVCLFVHFFWGGGGGGGGESELPFILSKTGFGYGGAKRLPKVYLLLRVQYNRQIEEGWLI